MNMPLINRCFVRNSYEPPHPYKRTACRPESIRAQSLSYRTLHDTLPQVGRCGLESYIYAFSHLVLCWATCWVYWNRASQGCHFPKPLDVGRKSSLFLWFLLHSLLVLGLVECSSKDVFSRSRQFLLRVFFGDYCDSNDGIVGDVSSHFSWPQKENF